jgi:hypothetical protein
MNRRVILTGLVGLGGCWFPSNNSIVDIRGFWQQETIAEKTADIDSSDNGFVLLGDFDEDGSLDAASGFASSGTVSVHIQNSPFDWSSTVVSSGLGGIYALAAADLDSNHRLDIVAATGSGRVWLLFAPSYSGTAPAGWKTQALTNPVAVSEWNDVTIASFDDLSTPDIVATSAAGEVIVLWRCEGLPSRASDYQPFVIASEQDGGFEQLAVADVDDDGDLDLFACGRAGGVIWLENQGPYNATLPWIVHEISTSIGPTRLAAYDFDDDGDVDVAVTDRAAGQVIWFESRGFPRSDPWPEHLMADLLPGEPDAISVGDLDEDGNVDVLVGTDTVEQSIYALERMGDAKLLWRIQLVDVTNYDVGELPMGDIDGLDSVDFAATLAGSETPVVWYRNQ